MIQESVTDNFLADTRKFPRPRLAARTGVLASLRLSIPARNLRFLGSTIAKKSGINSALFCNCAPERGIPRTWDKILDTLAALNSRGELPDLSSLAGFQHRHDVAAPMKDEQDDGIALAA